MSRKARVKNPEGIYHVSSRSINEMDMFTDNDDKDYFLKILKMIVSKYEVKVYAYCLMSNHYHIMLDTCDYDISKLMKILNLRYVKYVNKKYHRRGPLLDGRFFSSPVKDMNYLLYLSAYIHNNSSDLSEYRNRETEYEYSSVSSYLENNIEHNKFVNTDLILDFLDNNKVIAKKSYLKLLNCQKKVIEYIDLTENFDFLKFKSLEIPKRKNPTRNFNPEILLRNLCKKLGEKYEADILRNTVNSKIRKVAAYLFSVFTNENSKTLINYFGSISPNTFTNMVKQGFFDLENNKTLRTEIISSLYKI